MFAYIKCPCGRTLRAQRSPERATIQCWDCKAEVLVPRYRSPGGPKPIERIRGAMASQWAETAAGVILLALAVAAAVAVPRFGGWLALAVLVAAATVYLRRIEDVGREQERAALGGEAPSPGWWAGVARLGLAVALVAALAFPLWLVDGSRQAAYVPPVLPVPGPMLALIAIWMLLPVVAFALVARDARGPLGPDLAMAAAWRRRWAMLATLLLPMIVFAVVEAAVLGVLLATDSLATVLADLFPLAPGQQVDGQVIVADGLPVIPDSIPEMLRHYASGLLRGATLLGSVPLSFLRGPIPRITLIPYGPLRSEGYLLARLGITAAAMIALIGALAFQSNLLGKIGLWSPRSGEAEEEEDEDLMLVPRRVAPSSLAPPASPDGASAGVAAGAPAAERPPGSDAIGEPASSAPPVLRSPDPGA